MRTNYTITRFDHGFYIVNNCDNEASHLPFSLYTWIYYNPSPLSPRLPENTVLGRRHFHLDSYFTAYHIRGNDVVVRVPVCQRGCSVSVYNGV